VLAVEAGIWWALPSPDPAPPLALAAMLAVKLHKNPRPWLGQGSNLVPIASWDTGRVHLRQWVRALTTTGARKSNNKINHLTLVRLPDDFPVALRMFYGNSNFIRQVVLLDPMPWCDVPPEAKQALRDWWDGWGRPETKHHQCGGVMADEPRIVLGRRLPDSAILWTKDARLLWQRRSRSRTERQVRD
jgi:hypothetical protein